MDHRAAVLLSPALACLLAGCGARSELDSGSAAPDDLPPIVDLASGAAATCALRAEGTVVCWGRPFATPTDVPHKIMSPGYS